MIHPGFKRRVAETMTLLALTLLLALGLAPAGIPDAQASSAQRAENSWIHVDTTAQGQLLAKLQEKLVGDYGQSTGDYDYSVVTKLRISGTLNAQDYTDLRSAEYAGTSIEKLDLSGVVDSSTRALNGMTAMTEVSLPPVGNYNVANPFQGDTSLRHVIVAPETYQFGSTTTFNGIDTLQRITFLHTTKPSLNASTFNGSNNADPADRDVIAVVPDRSRGDYGTTAFTQYFADVAETASSEDLAELQSIIDEASELDQADAAASYRWTLLQQASAGAETVHDDPNATSADVYKSRLILQAAINRLGVSELGLSLKVTKDAEVDLSWKNGTAQHFAEFTPRPVTRVAAFSDEDYDVYVPTVTMPYVTQNIATAVIPGQTDKVAKVFTMSAALANSQYTLDLTPLAGREDTALLIPGFGAGDNRGLYTNLDDTGVLNLDVGEHFDLDAIRTQQAQLDQINNLFIEPDFEYEVSGQSVNIREIGREGRRQLRIDAEQPGVSVIKVTYGPLHYLTANDNGTPGNTNWSFNGIDPQNTGLVVVDVGGDTGEFDTGIEVRNELDTYYFDKSVGERDFEFTPAEGTTVRVHDPLNVTPWGDGWRNYDAASDGSFRVKLKGGRNIVELTNEGKVRYRVVRAKGVDVDIVNSTDPGQPFTEGDTARISITGIEGGIEKLGGIYNPAFVAGTKAKLTYRDGGGEMVSNEAPQYQTAITTFNVDYAYPGEEEKVLEGDMSIGGLGAEWPFHRQIPLEGKPANLAAGAIGPYRLGATPAIFVYDGQVSTSPGAPGTPTGLHVIYGNASAEVSWVAPTVSGGLPVIGYHLRYSSDGGESWETRTLDAGTSHTLDGLTNGTEYEVQVAAFNRERTGSYTTSITTTPIGGDPTVSLSADTTDVRVGDKVSLDWSSDGADSVVATGAWSGPRPLSGTEEIVVDRAGELTFSLTATADGRSSTAKVDVHARLAAADLSVNAPARLIRAGRKATVSAAGLQAGESYRITIGGITADTGVASGDGSVSRSVRVPRRLSEGTVPVQVFGSIEDRFGATSLRVITAKRLTVKLRKTRVRKGKKQRVTVSGLAAGEPVRILYRGRNVASRRASAEGTVSKIFAVGRKVGTGKVKVVGATGDRNGSRKFKVVR